MLGSKAPCTAHPAARREDQDHPRKTIAKSGLCADVLAVATHIPRLWHNCQLVGFIINTIKADLRVGFFPSKTCGAEKFDNEEKMTKSMP